MLDMCRKTLLALALFSTYILSTDGISLLARNGSFPAILAFGDSILDTGNNNRLLTFMKGNYWPYGRSYTLRVPTGRFGNGRVFSDIVAEGLGIKKSLPAYRKLFIAPSDLRTGVCFASGGAGVDPITSRMLRVLSPSDQVSDFKGYKLKLKATAGIMKANDIIANAVFLVSEGNNDIGITFFGTPTAIMRGMTRRSYTTRLVGWNKAFMKRLYDEGARKFAVMGTLPLGCLPMARIFMGGFVIFCNLPANLVAQDYNRKLERAIKYWPMQGFRGAKFVYVDMYNSLYNVIRNKRRYGFTNEKNGCCCMPTAIIPCRNPDKYVFYDFAHPTEKAYKTIGKKLVEDIKRGLA